ncbi:MAG: hypothetical protein NVSMB21_13390 [Vulcanimicrobiaceae bacterium]
MNATATLAPRIAIVDTTAAFHVRLRALCGLGPAAPSDGKPIGLGYCGREFRAYPAMTIGDASRLYGALNAGWDAPRLHADLALAGMHDRFEIKRMKRGFQRAIVLAYAMAARPELLVVENAEEFDEPGAFALLEVSVTRVDRAIVTYGTYEALDTKASRAKTGDGAAVAPPVEPPSGTARYGHDALHGLGATLAANDATLALLERAGHPA